MITVHDVASYILQKQGKMSTMKLQKLVYYCQVWSLVWDEKPLFKEEIQAWANGPVIPKLYKAYKKQFQVSKSKYGNSKKLKKYQIETINAVLKTYGSKPAYWLSNLTHKEKPWRNARKHIASGERGSTPININDIYTYYANF